MSSNTLAVLRESLSRLLSTEVISKAEAAPPPTPVSPHTSLGIDMALLNLQRPRASARRRQRTAVNAAASTTASTAETSHWAKTTIEPRMP